MLVLSPRAELEARATASAANRGDCYGRRDSFRSSACTGSSEIRKALREYLTREQESREGARLALAKGGVKIKGVLDPGQAAHEWAAPRC
jgi:hypothetical protein